MRTFGATLIIAGTTIGAGMLALPIEARDIGFFPSILLMLVMWAWMYGTAMQTVDLFLDFKKETLPDLCQKALGRWGYLLSLSSLFLLFYSLLAAYTAGSTSLFNMICPKCGYLFVVPLALSVFWCLKVADFTNRFLFALKIIVFAAILLFLVPYVKTGHLMRYSFSADYQTILPIFFTAFGFHGSIPVMISYVGPNKKDLKKVMFWGSLIPLFVYVVWLALGLGVTSVPPATLDAFVLAIGNRTPNFGLLVNIFSLLAIATSYIGVFMSLYDILSKNVVRVPLIAFALTFLPSFLFGMFYPQGFILALTYAASFLSIFAIILPGIIALKCKKGSYVFNALSVGVGLVLVGLVFF